MKQKTQNKSKKHNIEGIIKVNSRGVGYLRTPDLKEDLEIENYFLRGAFDGDKVLAIPHPHKKSRRAQGEVVKILERAKSQFIGTLEKIGDEYFLKPDNKKFYRQIIVPRDKTLQAKKGQKVLVRITSWGDQKIPPQGQITKVLGEKGVHEVEIQSIVFDKGFEMEFPASIEQEAEKIAEEARKNFQEEIKQRRDFRDIKVFTIDPIDAKDFDDAVSIKKVNDELEVGIHIADVSYYVKEKSSLDREAKKRGFSIYLVDRTIPMLPEVLSNDLCSLKPNEDRLTFSAVFNISKNGEIRSRWFGKGVINSKHRFSYEDAQKVLDKKSGDFFEDLNILNNLAKDLREKRFKKGAIDFDTEEVKFELDKDMKPVRVFKKERLETHKLIEELMLLANREVAEFVYKKIKGKKSGFLFRIHDLPDKEKIKELSIFLRALGYDLRLNQQGEVSSKDLNALFQKIDGKAEESLIKTAAVRSMSKAVYSTRNIGHFGLAFQYYAHFTSPIRRYPDLLVHRFLLSTLQNKEKQIDFAPFYKLATELSEKEVKIAEAERESIKYKQVEFMTERLGQVFDGVISGVTEWGVYVEEKETKSEGMIKLRDLGDDFYDLDEKQYALIGKRTKRKLQLGDKVKVKVKKADLESRQIDYELV